MRDVLERCYPGLAGASHGFAQGNAAAGNLGRGAGMPNTAMSHPGMAAGAVGPIAGGEGRALELVAGHAPVGGEVEQHRAAGFSRGLEAIGREVLEGEPPGRRERHEQPRGHDRAGAGDAREVPEPGLQAPAGSDEAMRSAHRARDRGHGRFTDGVPS